MLLSSRHTDVHAELAYRCDLSIIVGTKYAGTVAGKYNEQ